RDFFGGLHSGSARSVLAVRRRARAYRRQFRRQGRRAVFHHRPNGAGKTCMVNCISGRYWPSEGTLIYRGHDITDLNPTGRASLGIGRPFQNLALFHHMSVLDNIMVGRHPLLKNNFITGSLYWLTGARREELEHRRKVEEIIDFLDLQSVRKATAGTLSYG